MSFFVVFLVPEGVEGDRLWRGDRGEWGLLERVVGQQWERAVIVFHSALGEAVQRQQRQRRWRLEKKAVKN